MITRCYVRVGLPGHERLASTESFVESPSMSLYNAAALVASEIEKIREDATFIEVRVTITDR